MNIKQTFKNIGWYLAGKGRNTSNNCYVTQGTIVKIEKSVRVGYGSGEFTLSAVIFRGEIQGNIMMEARPNNSEGCNVFERRFNDLLKAVEDFRKELNIHLNKKI